jgi:DNA modification methylase
VTAIIGDCRTVLPTLDACSVQTVVTSPPYWGLRDYGHPDQIGLEPTPTEYVASIVGVMREVRRVLREDGTLWLNLGDSYIANESGSEDGSTLEGSRNSQAESRRAERAMTTDPKSPARDREGGRPNRRVPDGMKVKDLAGIPWMVAFALRADGWWLRSDVVWSKPNPMPEPVADRPSKSHEYLFLLSRSATYFYDRDAVAEPAVSSAPSGNGFKREGRLNFAKADGSPRGNERPWDGVGGTRNARSVWTIATTPYAGAHFATMPPELAKRCILAGSRIGDVVLDPFLGSGTVGMVAEQNGRRWVGCELQPKYEPLIKERTAQVGLFGRAS